jgi:hypothetical protein
LKRILVAISFLALFSAAACGGSSCDDMLSATKTCFQRLGISTDSLPANCDGNGDCDKKLDCAKNAAENSCTSQTAYLGALQACNNGGC